jgi:hypothetical protein
MSNENKETKDPQGQGGDSATPADKGGDQMIPKARFDEVNGKYKDGQKALEDQGKRIADLEAQIKANGDKALEEQGKYKELSEKQKLEIDSLKAKAESAKVYETRISEIAKAEIDSLPEGLRDLVPEGDPLNQLAYITKLKAKQEMFSGKPAGSGPVTPKPAGGGAGAPQDKQIEALEEEMKKLDGRYDQLSQMRKVSIINELNNLRRK